MILDIATKVSGIDKLVKLSNRLAMFKIKFLGICADELLEFEKVIKADNDIPEDYKRLLFVAYDIEENIAAITIEVPERFKWERFGNRREWAIYHCPRRGYAGGKVVKEWTGPDFIKIKWATYKPIFMSKVKSRMNEATRRSD